MSEAPAPAALKPGILVITLHEARGLSLPGQYHNPSLLDRTRRLLTHGSQGTPSLRDREFARYMPYALVDFEKVQVFINSVDGTRENPLWAGSNTQYKFDVSRAAELTVHVFIRNPSASRGTGRTQDICLGVVRLQPRFDTRGDNGSRSAGYSGVEWVDMQQGTGKLQLGVEYVENQPGKLSIDNFDLLKVVGKGSFGKVMQVRKIDTNRIYALKTIRKAKIISQREVLHTLAERSALAQINNPFIVPLKFTFQSPEKLYFVLAFVNGGELFHHLSQEGRFDINRARFYIAELLCALECLHGFNVIYRDLKPENILLDYQGHIALCDFGLCKLEMKDEDSTNTFCGTPEYLAPELLIGKGYNKTVDWWTLGVLLYEMLTGLPPFYDENINEMYRKILMEPLSFPGSDVVPPVAKDLLTKLLNRDPTNRLGANGAPEIKAHPFFHAIDWRKLLQRKYEPTFKPNVASPIDTDNFESIFVDEPAQDSWNDDPILSQTQQGHFVGFSFRQPVAGLNAAGGSIQDPAFIRGSQ
ncbi:uncharacterized protein PFLUO_LOCUS6263 [Penicillium psychrofluorescens]|uniref:uncharacterized protein n=1 Tax=Penicillium psychrofluorescens TaxID=3158075 RepID=UPI003CCD4D85